ncbi:hypothetical protein D6D01_05770 [Aureobasidium pullulans]|uniref:Uncharacterized protein n=1 Tax=Aureobasidium pullulans TaxID=5580 RepID=A0A4V4JV44_AURPU|nr:hypothetical protein D6D01_05770 [Aureobasidium pullulans]
MLSFEQVVKLGSQEGAIEVWVVWQFALFAPASPQLWPSRDKFTFIHSHPPFVHAIPQFTTKSPPSYFTATKHSHLTSSKQHTTATMDPYSSEGELVNMHTAFVQGQYQQVIDFDTSIFSAPNQPSAQILKYRAQLALQDYDSVSSSISSSDASSDHSLAAVKVYASYAASSFTSDSAVSQAESLSQSNSDNLSVQLLCGAVLARAGKTDEAIALLSQHQGSLDAVAMSTQIHLSNNRADLAAKEAKSARSFAQDALLVNLAESWISLREGGDAKYQQAFYVFEELAQAPGSSAVTSLVAQAVSELHLGRYPEAETALQQALDIEPDNTTALANAVVLFTATGDVERAAEMKKKLQGTKGGEETELLQGLAAKKEAFDAACEKYQPKLPEIRQFKLDSKRIEKNQEWRQYRRDMKRYEENQEEWRKLNKNTRQRKRQEGERLERERLEKERLEQERRSGNIIKRGLLNTQEFLNSFEPEDFFSISEILHETGQGMKAAWKDVLE